MTQRDDTERLRPKPQSASSPEQPAVAGTPEVHDVAPAERASTAGVLSSAALPEPASIPPAAATTPSRPQPLPPPADDSPSGRARHAASGERDPQTSGRSGAAPRARSRSKPKTGELSKPRGSGGSLRASLVPEHQAPEGARYSILGSIHRGGMGEILLARVDGAEGFTRKVVLKGLLSRLSEDNISYQLFMREACLMACLDHPNIVRVFDLPYVGDKPYLAMEYLRGRNFHQVIQRSAAHRGMPVRVALFVVAEALRGLHYAHNAKDEHGRLIGIIHRDVSPGNILVSFFGEVKVTDFGIAKIANAPKFTGPRSIRGKARYVAPEQVHGEQATVLSDIYSAGVVLAEALLGEPLWERATVPETLLAIVTEDRERTIDRVLRDRPGVPGLRSVLRGALALDARDRFPTALQFAETLEAISKSIGGPATHVDLGIYVRKLFADAPDLPQNDGFGATGIPVPELISDLVPSEPEAEQTDPTVIALEPEWIKEQSMRATTSMRASDPSVRAERPADPPPVTPVIASEDLPPGARASSTPPRKGVPPPPPSTSRIKATPWPAQAAVVRDPIVSQGLSDYSLSFSEPMALLPTDEEPSRDIERIQEKEELTPRRRAKLDAEDSSSKLRAITSAHGLTLLIAGIFIGASLAIAGCVLALILGH